MQHTPTPWSSLYWRLSVRKYSGSYIALWLALNGLLGEECGAASDSAWPGATLGMMGVAHGQGYSRGCLFEVIFEVLHVPNTGRVRVKSPEGKGKREYNVAPWLKSNNCTSNEWLLIEWRLWYIVQALWRTLHGGQAHILFFFFFVTLSRSWALDK